MKFNIVPLKSGFNPLCLSAEGVLGGNIGLVAAYSNIDAISNIEILHSYNYILDNKGQYSLVATEHGDSFLLKDMFVQLKFSTHNWLGIDSQGTAYGYDSLNRFIVSPLSSSEFFIDQQNELEYRFESVNDGNALISVFNQDNYMHSLIINHESEKKYQFRGRVEVINNNGYYCLAKGNEFSIGTTAHNKPIFRKETNGFVLPKSINDSNQCVGTIVNVEANEKQAFFFDQELHLLQDIVDDWWVEHAWLINNSSNIIATCVHKSDQKEKHFCLLQPAI